MILGLGGFVEKVNILMFLGYNFRNSNRFFLISLEVVIGRKILEYVFFFMVNKMLYISYRIKMIIWVVEFFIYKIYWMIIKIVFFWSREYREEFKVFLEELNILFLKWFLYICDRSD